MGTRRCLISFTHESQTKTKFVQKCGKEKCNLQTEMKTEVNTIKWGANTANDQWISVKDNLNNFDLGQIESGV